MEASIAYCPGGNTGCFFGAIHCASCEHRAQPEAAESIEPAIKEVDGKWVCVNYIDRKA